MKKTILLLTALAMLSGAAKYASTNTKLEETCTDKLEIIRGRYNVGVKGNGFHYLFSGFNAI